MNHPGLKPGQGFARRVTKDNLETFKGYLASKEQKANRAKFSSKQSTSPGTSESSLFVGVPIHLVIWRLPPAAKETTPVTAFSDLGTESTLPHWAGEEVWRKPNLSPTDAARPPKSQSNPKNIVSLTEAGYTVGGYKIDKTTYFRNIVFGELKWEPSAAESQRRDTYVDTQIFIDSADLGTHKLLITHKPARAAGQGNYTTALHWGTNLGLALRTQFDVRGKILTLYKNTIKNPPSYTILIV